MKHLLSFCLFLVFSFVMNAQEIKAIKKAQNDILEKNKTYNKAIKSSYLNSDQKIIYQNKDSLIFKKEVEDFFIAFEKSIREEEGSLNFISNFKEMTYVLYISNTGYTDAFYYDFGNEKVKMAFKNALNTFIANYKWQNTKREKIMHSGVYIFK